MSREACCDVLALNDTVKLMQRVRRDELTKLSDERLVELGYCEWHNERAWRSGPNTGLDGCIGYPISHPRQCDCTLLYEFTEAAA